MFPDEALVAGKISVTMPSSLIKSRGLSANGSVVEIDNPLYAYRFPEGTADEYKVCPEPFVILRLVAPFLFSVEFTGKS